MLRKRKISTLYGAPFYSSLAYLWLKSVTESSFISCESFSEQPHLTFLDEMTLSVFEDSGWYKVNYEYAEDFPWGKGQGCQFGDKKSCQDNAEFFCNSR